MATLRISKKAKASVTKKLPTKKTPTKKTAKKRRPSLASTGTPKQRADRVIASIHHKLDDMHSTAWDVGRALIELREPAIWKLYQQSTFKEFLNEEVMPYTSALRFISFAESYSKKIALELGIERGVQLARLARVKKLGAPEGLWKRNAVLAKKPKRRAKELSAAELERLVRAALLQKAKKQAKLQATTREKKAVDDLEAWWTSASDWDADFELDLKKRKVRIELDLDELLE